MAHPLDNSGPCAGETRDTQCDGITRQIEDRNNRLENIRGRLCSVNARLNGPTPAMATGAPDKPDSNGGWCGRVATQLDDMSDILNAITDQLDILEGVA